MFTKKKTLLENNLKIENLRPWVLKKARKMGIDVELEEMSTEQKLKSQLEAFTSQL